jgi:hypothetical protein
VVAENVALLCAVATVTLAGIDRAGLLLFKDTVEFVIAALFKVTVQTLDELLPRLEGEQEIEESCAGALAVSVKA